MQRWLSVAAGPIAYGPGLARGHNLFGIPGDPTDCVKRSAQLLSVMDAELNARPFLTGTAPTIADVACYAYIAHAPEGGVSLEPYPHVRASLARVEQQPRFVGMTKSPARV